MIYNYSKLIFLLMIGIIFIINGCANIEKVHYSQLKFEKEKIKKICLISQIKVYQLTAGGIREYREDYTRQAKKNIEKAIKIEIKEKLNSVVLLLPNSTAPDKEEILKELSILYSYIQRGIYFNHFYKKQKVQKVIDSFNYPNLREFKDIFQEVGTNYFLFFWGVDNISTGGRIALQVATMLIASAVGVSVHPNMGISIMNVSLVNVDTGRLLWNVRLGAEGICDFRKYENVKHNIHSLFDNLPN